MKPSPSLIFSPSSRQLLSAKPFISLPPKLFLLSPPLISLRLEGSAISIFTKEHLEELVLLKYSPPCALVFTFVGIKCPNLRAAARLAPRIESSTNGRQGKSKMSGPLITACTPPPPPPPPAPPEMGQVVCGSCRHLLSYPKGAKHVQCSCCQTVNLVLEANQVGNVKCEGCHVLLMYPYGAPSVRCSSCNFVTEIGANNRRPPLSVQQGQAPLPPHPPPNTVS